MAVANRSNKAPATSERLLTVADLAALPSELPSGTVRYELDDGRLIIMSPTSRKHGKAELRLANALFTQGEQRNLGEAQVGEAGIILRRNPDRVVGVDAAFFATSSLPIRESSEEYYETIPDLVVEVRSKNDTGPEVLEKVNEYLEAGVRVVWVADPKKKTITAYRPKRKPKVFTTKDTLTVEDVIPGFQLPVAEVFR